MKLNRIELEAMMKAKPDDLMLYDGRVITVAEALGHIMRGEGAEVAPPAITAQPGQHTSPNVRISQEAANKLSDALYQELEQTGHIQGLTRTDAGRAYVHVRQGGSLSIQRSFDPETGEVGLGRGLDMRDFFDPNAPASSK